MDTRKITLIATIAAIALVAVGIGYAYTATTDNTGNTTVSTYVVVKQTDYSFGTGDIDVSTRTFMDNTTEKIEYQAVAPTGAIANKSAGFTAVPVSNGSATKYLYIFDDAAHNGDTLTITDSNDTANQTYKLTVSTTSGFTNLSAFGKLWLHITGGESPNAKDYWLEYSSNSPSAWTCHASGSANVVDLVLQEEVSYTTTLYLEVTGTTPVSVAFAGADIDELTKLAAGTIVFSMDSSTQ